ncbi:MAG: hypothetical protein SFT81_00415 [Candidatus Caenarcaniphilales bacterium]|nr:hypothetical protein [Candidatus Caenarcaniphilales bacterium]
MLKSILLSLCCLNLLGGINTKAAQNNIVINGGNASRPARSYGPIASRDMNAIPPNTPQNTFNNYTFYGAPSGYGNYNFYPSGGTIYQAPGFYGGGFYRPPASFGGYYANPQIGSFGFGY